jgi:molybdenum cofactor cytidylyltransferase
MGGIILAAGASTRMLRPKALLPWGTSTFVQEIAKNFQLVGLFRIVVVISDSDTGAKIRELVEGIAEVAINPNPERGMLSSLQIGAQHLIEQNITQALITPVDQPQFDIGLCQKLCEALAQNQWAVAAHQGQWGHPYAAADLTEFTRLDLAQSAQLLLQKKSPLLIEGGPQVLFNINTPEEYQNAYLKNQKEPSHE